MRRIPWELLLILAILVIAASAAAQATPEEQRGPKPADLRSDSTLPEGGRALYLWLQALGYRVERLEYRRFQPDDATDVLFILAPIVQPTREEQAALRRWLERGGTLIIAGQVAAPAFLPSTAVADFTTSAFLRDLGAQLRSADAVAEAAPSAPAFLHPPVQKARLLASAYISSTAMAPLVGPAERPLVATAAVGSGRVYVLAGAYALTNEGIAEADNAAMILNMLPASGIVAFDEVHHGRAETRSFTSLLLRQPWGWALMYVFGMGFIYLALSGRRLGRPAPVLPDTRRPASEYVVSLAGLLRRGGRGTWAARHYGESLRRQAAAALGLDLAADVEMVAARLEQGGELAPGVAGTEAARVLRSLNEGAGRGINEQALLRLAVEAERMINACTGRGR